jgi:hypothetical protein
MITWWHQKAFKAAVLAHQGDELCIWDIVESIVGQGIVSAGQVGCRVPAIYCCCCCCCCCSLQQAAIKGPLM